MIDMLHFEGASKILAEGRELASVPVPFRAWLEPCYYDWQGMK